MKILLVEDDPNLGFVLKDNLEMNGYTVNLCMDGETAYNEYKTAFYNICILDIMLPKMGGLELATLIRKNNTELPILFLTSKGLKEDKIAGFKAGGDDYISKPFSIEELLLRIEVFLRRSKASNINIEGNVMIGKYKFEPGSLKLCLEDAYRTLTQKEASILHYFYLNKNKIIKREELLKSVWGSDDYFTGRSLDVFITKLRKYLLQDPNVEIQNLHGVGFRLEIKMGD